MSNFFPPSPPAPPTPPPSPVPFDDGPLLLAAVGLVRHFGADKWVDIASAMNDQEVTDESIKRFAHYINPALRNEVAALLNFVRIARESLHIQLNDGDHALARAALVTYITDQLLELRIPRAPHRNNAP